VVVTGPCVTVVAAAELEGSTEMFVVDVASDRGGDDVLESEGVADGLEDRLSDGIGVCESIEEPSSCRRIACAGCGAAFARHKSARQRRRERIVKVEQAWFSVGGERLPWNMIRCSEVATLKLPNGQAR
jgi:hypothetical protein